jgi:RHS repeat-associated protein
VNWWCGTIRPGVMSTRKIIRKGSPPANYPFGESWYSSGTTTKWKFTSYERDPESANDYAMARYDINRLGRFNSPDPVPGSIADPQSFNRYSYVRNNPLTLVDPTGLDCVYFGSDGSTIESVDHSSGWDECYTNGGNWVNGTVTGWSYDPGTDTFTIQSSDTWYNYTTTQSAPGPEIIGSCSGDCIYSYSQSFSFGLSNLMNQPWMASIIIPVAPVPYLAGVGPAGSLAYNPKTHTLCAGLGIGAAGGKSVAGGPLSFGKMFNGQDYPSGANNLLSGGSISVGGNFVAILGGQLTINGSGVAVGPTIGAPGAGISATYSVCF